MKTTFVVIIAFFNVMIKAQHNERCDCYYSEIYVKKICKMESTNLEEQYVTDLEFFNHVSDALRGIKVNSGGIKSTFKIFLIINEEGYIQDIGITGERDEITEEIENKLKTKLSNLKFLRATCNGENVAVIFYLVLRIKWDIN